jgi:signal transduction histidine kinase
LISLLTYLFIRDRQLQDKLNQLNLSLQERVEREVSKNRDKDKLIFQQAKLASLGEMIGNIAHQWRQPLNTLGIIIQDVENAFMFDELDEEYVGNMANDAMQQITYMSSTIDDFRNFFKSDDGEPFQLSDGVENALSITRAGLKSSGITLIEDIRDNPTVIGSKNQYIQVLINLVKNAQDVLVEKEVERARIKIALKQSGELSILTVEDNGGGIPSHIMEKIFEPYFTTKHQSVGTGLGLYMSKMIIEQNFRGKLMVENIDDGAKFSLLVPISKE